MVADTAVASAGPYSTCTKISNITIEKMLDRFVRGLVVLI